MKISVFVFLALLTLAVCCEQSAFAAGGPTCATATVVGPLPYADSGQLDPGIDPGCSGVPVNDVFYVFTAPETKTYKFDMCGSADCCEHAMRLWTQGACCGGTEILVTNGCSDGNPSYPSYNLAMTAGQTVYIELGKTGTNWTDPPDYQFHVTCVIANDNCPGTNIPYFPFTASGNACCGTSSLTNTECGNLMYHDAFWNVHFDCPKTVTLSLCNSPDLWDAAISIYLTDESGPCAELNWLYCIQDFCGNGMRQGSFTFEADETYIIAVHAIEEHDCARYQLDIIEEIPTVDSLTIVRGAGPDNHVYLNWAPPCFERMVEYHVYRSQSLPLVATPANYYANAFNDPMFTDVIGPNPPYYYGITVRDFFTETISPLSEVVGFTKVEGYSSVPFAGQQTYAPFSISFMTWANGGLAYGNASTFIADILTDQPFCGTIGSGHRIINLSNGAFGYRSLTASCNWSGSLTNLTTNRVYGYNIRTNEPAQNIYICGTVDLTTPQPSVSIISGPPGAPGITYLGWRDPRQTPVDELGLVSQGFTGGSTIAQSDRLISLGPIDMGYIAWYDTTTYTFEGNLTHLFPGQGYAIENTHSGHSWTYTYNFNPVP